MLTRILHRKVEFDENAMSKQTSNSCSKVSSVSSDIDFDLYPLVPVYPSGSLRFSGVTWNVHIHQRANKSFFTVETDGANEHQV